MKTLKILSLLCIVFLTCSCKQNTWLDWKTQNELWLLQNAKQQDVKTTASGLQYKCINPGWDRGPRPDDAKAITIKYSGRLINGYEFDNHDAYTGYVNTFVPGFSEGLKKMNEFGKFEFYIPYELGYGVQGAGTEGTTSHIPPYSTLIFEVELMKVH